MRRYLLIPSLLAAAGAALAGATASLAADAQGDPMAICRATDARYIAAAESGDVSKIAALFATDAVWAMNAPNGVVQGRQAIAAALQPFYQPGVKKMTGDTKVARQLGDVVLCTGEWATTFAPGAPANEISGYFAYVLVKSEDKWQYKQMGTNITLPPQPLQPQSQAR